MRLSRQIDEAAGFWSDAFGRGIFDLAIWLFDCKWSYRFWLLNAALWVWQLDSWADMKQRHMRDEFFYGYVESYQRALHHQQLGR